MALFMQPPQQAPGMFGGQPPAGAFGRMEQTLNNPIVSALAGFGGGMLNSAQNGGNFAQGLQAGIGGGISGAYGAARMRRQKMDEEERNRAMRELIERYAQIGRGSPGVPGGLFASTRPAYPQGMLG